MNWPPYYVTYLICMKDVSDYSHDSHEANVPKSVSTRMCNFCLQLCTVNSDPRSKLLTRIGPNDTVRGPGAAAPVPPREPRPPARRAPGGRDAAPRTAAAAERACVHRTGSWSGAGDDSAVRRSGTVFRGHVLSACKTETDVYDGIYSSIYICQTTVCMTIHDIPIFAAFMAFFDFKT